MKYITFTLMVALLSACSQNKSGNRTDEQIAHTAYVNHPNPTDSFCISDINRAKKDIEGGKIVFTQSMGLGSGHIRYEDELRKLCEQHSIVFDFDLISCLVFEGQTQGCYGQYMDETIKQKFGPNFKTTLHLQADSMFLVNVQLNNKTVQYWDCDERPRLHKQEKETSNYIAVPGVNIMPNKGQWPFFDVGFIIEKDSTISNFYVRNFVAESNENEKFKDELFSIAIQYMQSKYPTWIPGKVQGVPVRTDNNIRLFFTR